MFSSLTNSKMSKEEVNIIKQKAINVLQKKYQQQLRSFNSNLAKNGALYLLSLRFIPLFPFFLINILAGLTNLSLYTFIWTTSLGIIPGTLIYTFAGKQLTLLSSPQDMISGKFIIALLLLTGLTLLPLLFKKYWTLKK